jgi:hypothetical protein
MFAALAFLFLDPGFRQKDYYVIIKGHTVKKKNQDLQRLNGSVISAG